MLLPVSVFYSVKVCENYVTVLCVCVMLLVNNLYSEETEYFEKKFDPLYDVVLMKQLRCLRALK